MKWRACEPGPNYYKPKTNFKHLIQKKSCFRMRKPEIIDEKVYEIVGGTTKVMRPDLLNKVGRTALDIAAKTFVKNRNVTTMYPQRNPHPDKISETMLH